MARSTYGYPYGYPYPALVTLRSSEVNVTTEKSTRDSGCSGRLLPANVTTRLTMISRNHPLAPCNLFNGQNPVMLVCLTALALDRLTRRR